MKILHTADWHIGKKLHRHDLSQDFALFINWLCNLIENNKIDVLLISGDVFDLANPSSEARTAYYQALLALNKLKCKIIITGGNHDSPAVLNAPRDILKTLDIHVIGSWPSDSNEVLIPIENKSGKTEVLIAAIPYLRDPDLRQNSEGLSYETKVQAIREGIKNIFQSTAQRAKELFPDTPLIGMGHLYAAGASSSDSERDIQLGNEASFEAGHFGTDYDYIALGHIHRPQKINAAIPVYYSGSPLPLSFSERSDHKRILLLDTENGFEPESIDIPAFRSLIKLSGSMNELKAKLDNLEPGEHLDTLIEIELVEEKFNPSLLSELDELVQKYDCPGLEIVKHRARFMEKLRGSSELFAAEQHLEDLSPREVFEKRLEVEQFDLPTTELLMEAFDEILEEVQKS